MAVSALVVLVGSQPILTRVRTRFCVSHDLSIFLLATSAPTFLCSPPCQRCFTFHSVKRRFTDLNGLIIRVIQSWKNISKQRIALMFKIK